MKIKISQTLLIILVILLSLVLIFKNEDCSIQTKNPTIGIIQKCSNGICYTKTFDNDGYCYTIVDTRRNHTMSIECFQY
jgi:hypothetical protein